MPISIALWDCATALLVVFPFLTGGVWIERPGMFIELSDIGIQTILLLVWALLLYWFNRPIEKSRVLHYAANLWRAWETSLDKYPKSTIWGGAVFFGLLWSLSSLTRHWDYGSHAYDLTIFTGSLWNLAHGFGFYSSIKGGISEFADHLYFTLLLILPLYKLFPKAETLLILQAFGLAAAGVPLYFLCKQYLKHPEQNWIAAAVPLMCWAYAPNRNAYYFDFHPDCWLLGLELAGIYFFQSLSTRRRILGALFFLLAVLTKETGALDCVGVGAAWVLGAAPESSQKFTKKLGLILLVLGVAIFSLELKWVPKILHYEYAYQSPFEDLGHGLGAVILSPFTKPVLFFSRILGSARLKYLFWTLAPLGFLPFLNLGTSLAAIPTYLILFLCQGEHRLSTGWHYSVQPSIGLFWSLPLAIYRLEKMKSPAFAKYFVLAFALIFFGRSELFRIRELWPNEHANWLSSKLIPCLQTPASMSAEEALTPHLSERFWINEVPFLTEKSGKLVDCVVLDEMVHRYDQAPADRAQVEQTLKDNYHEIYSCGSVRVFQQGNPTCMSCTPDCR